MPPLRRFVKRSISDSAAADDAAQHVLVQVLQALPRYRDQGVPFLSWILRIAHNHIIDVGRDARWTTAVDPHALPRLSDERNVPDEDPAPTRDALRTLIAPLPGEQQRVILLLYEHDCTPAQAGAVLGRSAASVRQLHKRARDALREIVLLQSGP